MGESKNTEAVETFIRRWQGREGGQERANYVSFLNELIVLLGLPPPDPADATHEHNDYVFERAVRKHKDEGDSHGRIDLYKKNSFVLEAKQSRLKGAKKIAGQNDLFTAEIPEEARGRRGADRAWDVLMLIAKRLAQVSLALEKKNYPAQDVAMLLMRCLFTMFAEDVGLLPEKSFKEVLEECEKNPEAFTHDVGQLWEAMDLGTWAHVLKTKVKTFNGEFF